MKKDIPEEQDLEVTEEHNEIPDWSNIDATSIYRAGNSPSSHDKKPELNQLVKETNNFFKMFVVFLIIFAVIIAVSSYY